MKRTSLISLVIVLMLAVSGIAVAQSETTGTVTRNANLRDGPGTTYGVVGSARAGDTVIIVDENTEGDWYKLDDGKWIAAFLVSVEQPTVIAATSTPQPTVTPLAPISELDKLRYAGQVGPAIVDISDALQQMSALLQAPKLGDNNWIIDLAVTFVAIRSGHDTLSAIEPPASLSAIHDRVLSATQDCSDATYAIADGIDNFDADELERGAELLSSCAEKTVALSADLAALQTPAPTPTRQPTATSTRRAIATPTRTSALITPTPRKTATPSKTPTPTEKPSARFGSPLSAWRSQYGEPQSRFGYQVYDTWEILPLPGNRAQHIERLYDPPVKMNVAKADVATILPADSSLKSSYEPEGREYTQVDLYSSETLGGLLPATAWINASPGEFIVIYKTSPDGVQRVIIGAGNNP